MGLFQKLKKNKNPQERSVTPPKLQDKTGHYTYSFSGADAIVYAWFDGMEDKIVRLESMSTVSISVHEAKGQARALGHRGIKGLSKGVRTIAGSLILTVIEDNPLRPLMDQLEEYASRNEGQWWGWSVDRDLVGTGSLLGFDYQNRIAPLLPPFNMMIQYVSEGALYAWPVMKDPRQVDINGAGLLVRGVEFLDEGMVTSTHDIVSEVTLSFLASDYKPMSLHVFTGGIRIDPPEAENQQHTLSRKLFPGVSNNYAKERSLIDQLRKGG